MTLPETCPLDDNHNCKGRECHLFCLEWRTREPICLIGYNTTSKVKSNNDGRKKDTYAEETFRKLGRQPLSKKRVSSETGDWTPKKPTEKISEKHLARKEGRSAQAMDFQEEAIKKSEPKSESKSEKDHEERLKERHAASEAEKASLRLEARLKKESPEEQTIICGKTQPKIQEKPKTPEKIISIDRNTTIFASCSSEGNEDYYLSGREEKIKKTADNREKRKKLDDVMEIDLPDVHDEEFWS
jgi:hypothetical protein